MSELKKFTGRVIDVEQLDDVFEITLVSNNTIFISFIVDEIYFELDTILTISGTINRTLDDIIFVDVSSVQVKKGN